MVQYARIVGTHNTVNKVFHVVALEAVFVQKPFTVERGIIGTFTCKASILIIKRKIEKIR